MNGSSIVIFLAFITIFCRAQTGSPDKGKYKSIRRFMDQATTDKLSGVLVYIDTPKDGEWIGASGFADLTTKEPIRSDHIFSLASIGKLYNAVAVMKLVEDGKLQLDDNVSKFLPDVAENLPNGQQLSLRHLLGHTSGLVNYENDTSLIRIYFSGKLKLDTLAHADVLKRYVFGKPARNLPGAEFHYSSTNYLLLAMIVDKIIPVGHSVYLRELIRSNGFPNTYYRQTPAWKNVHYYGDIDKDGILEDLTAQTFETTNWFTGDDGIYAPIDEAAQFLQRLMHGEILKPSSLDQMTAWNNEKNPDYGLGLMADRSFPYGLLMGHSGRGVGVTTDLYYFPKQDMTVAIFCNTGLRASARSFRKVYSKMRGRIVKKLFLF